MENLTKTLHLTAEQWGLASHSRAPYRYGSIADRLVKEAKRKTAQEDLDRFRLEDKALTIFLDFNYLEVMQ